MVYSVIQDTEGFMWFASNAGVYRYDGKNFRHFTVDDGLTDNDVLQIYQDRKGRIWFLTFNGYLSFWLRGKIHNPDNTPFLKKANIASSIAIAYEDRHGKLWMPGIKSGIIVIDDTAVQTIIIPPEMRMKFSYNLYEEVGGDVWFFYYQNTMVNLNTKDSISFEGALNYISLPDKNGSVYMYVDNEIKKWENLKLVSLFSSSELPPAKKIINMLADGDSLWICTLNDGAYLYYNKKLQRRFLENSCISTAFADREGNLWFTSLNEGIYFVAGSRGMVENYDINSGLSAEKILSLASDSDSTIWIGYNNGIVDRITGKIKNTYDLKTKAEPNYFRVTSLLYDMDTLWCGTDYSTYTIVNNNIKRIRYFANKPYHYAVKQIIKDKYNNKFGSFSLNYLQYKKLGNEIYAFEMSDSIVRSFSSISLSDNQLLISTNHGLLELNPGKFFKSYSTEKILSKIRILDMKIDDEGLLLLSTSSQGIYILRDRIITQILSTENGMSDNSCGKLCLDKDHLYISTGRGVNVLVKKDNKWFFERTLTVQHGLLSNNVNDILTVNNKLYIGTDKGLSIIDKQSARTQTFYTSVKITEVETDSVILVNENEYSFDSDFRRLLLRFSYPVFNPMNKAFLKYRLRERSSTSTEWNQTNNYEVEFSSLVPGNYVFEIMPDVADENVQITTLGINIIPKWWQTTTSKALALLLLIGMILLIVRKRVKDQYERRLYELKQASMIEMERTRIASDMHDDIGADLTQMSIWLNILKQKELAGNNIIQKVSILSQDVLSKMDEIIWALDSVHNSTVDLFSYLHSFASESLESSDMVLEFKVDENFPAIKISAFQRRNIFLVMKELLHNTIKHSYATNVSISIYRENSKIIIKYSDNGRGFNVESNTKGLGLLTMKKRMDEINSNITIESFNGQGLLCTLSIDIND